MFGVFEIKIGLDGKRYAVFRDNWEAEQYEMWFIGCRVASFGQYENSYELTK